MPEETQQERERRAAEDRGRVSERLEQHFRDDDRRFEQIGVDVAETKRDVKSVKGEVRKLADAIREDRAVKDALATAAKDLADKQVSTKAFAVGVALVLVSVIGLFLSTARF